MKNILGQFVLKIKGGVNTLLAPAEDPRQTYTHVYRRQHDLLTNIQQALAVIEETRGRLATKIADMRAKLDELEQDAQQALEEGQEDLARYRLLRWQHMTTEVQVLENQVRELQQEKDQLSLIEQQLTGQIEEILSRQEVVAARHSAAEAQVHVEEAMEGVSTDLADIGATLKEAEQRAAQMQSRTSSVDQLIKGDLTQPAKGLSDPIDPALAQAAEMQLEALRRKLDKPKEPSLDE